MTAYHADVLGGGVNYQPSAFIHDVAGWCDDIVYSASVPQGILSGALTEAGDTTALSVRVKNSASLALLEAADSSSVMVDASDDHTISAALQESGDQAAVVAVLGEVVIIARHRLLGSIIMANIPASVDE